jgi:hypothetical protein
MYIIENLFRIANRIHGGIEPLFEGSPGFLKRAPFLLFIQGKLDKIGDIVDNNNTFVQ